MYYFAYGSNLHEPRMRGRVPSASVVGVARLCGYEIAFRKRGADGSMKADLDPASPETVWGVLYRIDADELPVLDAAEGEGYERIEVTVTRSDGQAMVDAVTYRARPEWIDEGRPFDWYRDLVVAGSRSHGLPEPYAAALEALDADPDPDDARAAANRP
jgi:gamma-glutamylcyclotransferase (GGCT)/AIG2-like uncharacterized protein YtfP